MDLDYIVQTDTFDAVALEATVRRLLEAKARSEIEAAVRFATDSMRVTPIWAETAFPGLRVVVPALLRGSDAPSELGIDLGFGDPMFAPVEDIAYQGVGPLRAVARETMIAWKIHGLVEWGRGRWRPKDLADLHVLLSEPIDETVTSKALDLAFSSRKTELSALGDLLFRPSWGESTGRRKRWRSFCRAFPGTPEFGEAKGRVLALLDRLGLSMRLADVRDRVLAEYESRAIVPVTRDS